MAFRIGSWVRTTSALRVIVRRATFLVSCKCGGAGLFPSSKSKIYTEQMDAQGLGDKLLWTLPPGDSRPPEKQTVGTWQDLTTCSPCKHFRALSIPALQFAERERERVPGQRKGLWVTSGSRFPKQSHPFTPYRKTLQLQGAVLLLLLLPAGINELQTNLTLLSPFRA